MIKQKIITQAITTVILLMGVFSGYSQIDIKKLKTETDTCSDLREKTNKQIQITNYFIKNSPQEATEYAEHALDNSLVLKDSTIILIAYKSLIISFSGANGCKKVEEYYPFGFTYARSKTDSAKYYTDMGIVFTKCGNLREAERNFNYGKLLYSQLNDKTSLSILHTNMGLMFSKNGKYYQASSNYLNALQISEELNDKESIASTYQNMGEVMALQKQYDKAVGYYNSALNIYQEIDSEPDLAAVYLNLGQIYIEQKQFDVAKHYLNKSYVIDTTYNLFHLESLALKQLGLTYLRNNQYESARQLVTAALYLQNRNNYTNLVPETSTLLAEIYLSQKKYDKALVILNQTEKIAKESGNTNLLGKIFLIKSSLLSLTNKHRQAYQYLKSSNKITDSIFNIEQSKSIMNLELAYQTEKKEKQIDELKFNDILRQEQLKNKTVQIYLLIVSTILIVIILISILIMWRRRHIRDSEQREKQFLQDSFAAEERAKDEIAHELHDDIGGQMIGMILQMQSYNTIPEEEIGRFQKIYQDLRRLSHSLNEPIFDQISLQEKIKNYLSELKEHAPFSCNFIDDFEYDWVKIVGAQSLQRNLYRMIQELITNTIKHAKATEVDIQLMNEESNLILIFEDNGIGFNDTNKQNLATIRKRVKLFEGQLEINNQDTNGTFILIKIPLRVR